MSADDWIKLIGFACGYSAFGYLLNGLTWLFVVLGLAAFVRAVR